MYMYACMFLRIFWYVYRYMHISTQIVYIYICAYMYIYTCVYIPIFLYVCRYMHINLQNESYSRLQGTAQFNLTSSGTHMYIYVYICIYIYICIFVYMSRYIHINTYTYQHIYIYISNSHVQEIFQFVLTSARIHMYMCAYV